MEVYKFGGASISSASRLKSVIDILKTAPKPLSVIVSAMGKMTNALEHVLDGVMDNDEEKAMLLLGQLYEYHDDIVEDLGLDNSFLDTLKEELHTMVMQYCGKSSVGYCQLYDMIVGYGELFSSAIVVSYIRKQGYNTKEVNMHKTLITNNKFRFADVDIYKSTKRLRSCFDDKTDIYVMQGFIGGTVDNERTTLGREGSDYTAAIVAYCIDATKVTIWKDVEGILNADPREVDSAELIPQMSYYEAVELAYSGAQVIHPKTIRPLQNKDIPLYVKSFLNPSGEGSVINSCISEIDIPVYIIKKSQVLLTVSPKDFSFAFESALERVFIILNKHKQSIGLIQSSAIQISVSVDYCRDFDLLIEELKEEFVVKYNSGLELVTIRGYSEDDIEEAISNRKIYIKQKTRRIVRILRGE